MKNKIKNFSKGDFQVAQPNIVFPETHIMIMAGEGDLYKGSFTIQNLNKGDIRGIVYPSSFRIHCQRQGFEGNPVKVDFTYDTRGLCPGQVEKGKFTIMCNGGEYELGFTAMIERAFVMTPYGKIQNLDDFKKLAIQDFSEATRLFRSKQFYDVLKYEEDRVRNLYTNMRKWTLDEQAVEEFLVGIKQKEKIFLTLSEEEKELHDVLEAKKDWIEIEKNTWGYVPIKIRAKGDFIQIKKERITTDDFVGSNYRLEYVVHENRLHAGRNYGKIFVETPYEALTVDVEVIQNGGTHDEQRREKELMEAQVMKEYFACISGRVQESADKAIRILKQLREMEPENEFYFLFQAHIYLRANREEEARWILENYNYNRFSASKKPEMSAYYLFLTAVLRKDVSHTNRVLEELNRLYMKYPSSWQYLCMIVNLDSKYQNYSERFRMLEREYLHAGNHVLFYAEAYTCLHENVVLLRKIGNFEIQVLNFASKYKLMTRELAVHAADLISHQKEYDKRLYYILERVYKLYNDPQILHALCTQLIKGNKTGSDYFKWYSKAVEQELKITQLYEYYMMSVNGKRMHKEFPRMVCVYFMHGNNLDYKTAALLYANILTYEDEKSELYHHYQDEMKKFAWQQLLKRHINEDLRVIYNRFLKKSDMTPERLDALHDICYTYHVKTKRPGMKYVMVIEKDGTISQKEVYREEGVQVCLYDKESRIVWEDKEGVHYLDSIPYDTKRMFYEIHFLEMCKKRMTDNTDSEKEDQSLPVTFDNLRMYGLRAFEDREVFLLCTKKIREDGYVEDDFLSYLCFEVLKKGYCDKVLLTYLSKFYCGATRDMKLLWRKSQEYEVQTHSLSERMITQMLFAEEMFHEEEVFEDYYYSGKTYFSLKQAYLAYVSREFVVKEREVGKGIFRIIMKEYLKEEYVADICKAALLKYYAGKVMDEEEQRILRDVLREMCENRMVFAFYLQYPESWLKEVQLYDKIIVEYRAEPGSKVKIVYQINEGDMEKLNYQTESLLPMYDTIFAKEFILYKGERVKYYFKESAKNRKYVSAKRVIRQDGTLSTEGKYGKLNAILSLPEEEQKKAMLQYQQEEEIAAQLFKAY